MGRLDQFTRDPGAAWQISRDRISQLEDSIQAWVALADRSEPEPGPLRGVPFGVKDTFDVTGLPYECGSPIFRGRIGDRTAGLVSRLQALGAVVMGKTHTTAFAYFDAAPTRNPHNPAHTPGGSSSGSAAAVAAGMVPFAIGSQTQGSVIRPASYCGITGFKPTYGKLPVDGLLPFAPTLDTAGLFTEDSTDMKLLAAALGMRSEESQIAVAVPRRFAGVDPAMMAALKDSVGRMSASGIRVIAEDFPDCFDGLTDVIKCINAYEGSRTMEPLWYKHHEAVGRKLAELIVAGLAIPASEYQEALARLEEARTRMNAFFREFGVAATPAAQGPPPAGLDFTGDPVMNRPWTGLRSPVITIPMPAPGLPLGLQLSAAPGADGALLHFATVAEAALALRAATR